MYRNAAIQLKHINYIFANIFFPNIKTGFMEQCYSPKLDDEATSADPDAGIIKIFKDHLPNLSNIYIKIFQNSNTK